MAGEPNDKKISGDVIVSSKDLQGYQKKEIIHLQQQQTQIRAWKCY